MSHDFPLGLSTAVYRVFRGATGAVGLLARFQYETDAERWCELLPYDRDYLHVLLPLEGAPKVYGIVEGRAE